MSDTAIRDRADAIARRFYPEVGAGGFSRVDASIEFYTRIAALLTTEARLLDYGAGRGAQITEDTSPYRRWLKTFKGRVAHVEGCDIDPAVLGNPFLDHASVFAPDAPLPYADASFDLVHAHWVFEHVADPARVAGELLRVTKPGGWVCAMTPNRWGYIAIAARIAGNARHVPILKRVQPGRHDFDVFPTHYRLNTVAAARRAFGAEAREGGADVVAYRIASDPSYHFNRAIVYAGFKMLHKLLPSALAPVLLVFARKR